MSTVRRFWDLLLHRPMFSIVIAFLIIITVFSLSQNKKPTALHANYRYKLTISVNTEEGVKTASNVVELDYRTVDFPMAGLPHNTVGEGIFLDLGPRHPPLIVALKHIIRKQEVHDRTLWAQDDPKAIILANCDALKSRLNSDPEKNLRQIEYIQILNNCSRSINLKPFQLPELITFSDINKPETVRYIDPGNISASLGEGIQWNFIKIEVTHDKITRDIEDNMDISILKGKFLDLPQIDANRDAHGLVLSDIASNMQNVR